MGEATKIEWCHHTFNPWIGCTKVAPECAHCYAEDLMAKRWKKVEWGDKGERKRTTTWKDPLKWNKAAEQAGEQAGERRRVFCASLADVFEDKPELVQWRKELFVLIDQTPWLDWLLLTKRPENIRKMWEGTERRDNVWLGTSCGHSDSLMRIPQLLMCRKLSPVLFLSAEPLLERIDLTRIEVRPALFPCRGLAANALMTDDARYYEFEGHLDWVIVGGESGPQARPCDTDWIRSIVQQCRNADVPVFVKQLGAKPMTSLADCTKDRIFEIASSKGGDPEEWPEDLRVREFPAAEKARNA